MPSYAIGTRHQVKLGKSRNVRQRLKDLQTASPLPLAVLWEGDIEEKSLHRVFADKRLHGEWFNITPSDVMEVVSEPKRIDALLSLPPQQLGGLLSVTRQPTAGAAIRRLLRLPSPWFLLAITYQYKTQDHSNGKNGNPAAGLLTLRGAAQRAGVTDSAIQRAIANGRLAVYLMDDGRRTLRTADVDRWAKEPRAPGRPAKSQG